MGFFHLYFQFFSKFYVIFIFTLVWLCQNGMNELTVIACHLCWHAINFDQIKPPVQSYDVI